MVPVVHASNGIISFAACGIPDPQFHFTSINVKRSTGYYKKVRLPKAKLFKLKYFDP